MPAFPPPTEANDDGDAPNSASSCGGTRHAGAGVAAGDGVDPAADCTMALNSNAASRGAVPDLPRPTEAKDDGGAPGSAPTCEITQHGESSAGASAGASAGEAVGEDDSAQGDVGAPVDNTPDDAGVPAEHIQAANDARALVGSDHFRVVLLGGVPHAQCRLKACKHAGVGQATAFGGGGGGAKKKQPANKPSLINFLRDHFGWTKSAGFRDDLGSPIHRTALAALTGSAGAALVSTSADDTQQRTSTTSRTSASTASEPLPPPAAASESDAAPAHDRDVRHQVREKDAQKRARAEKNAKEFSAAKAKGDDWTVGFQLVTHDGWPYLFCEYCSKPVVQVHWKPESQSKQHRKTCCTKALSSKHDSSLTSYFRRV